jgi:RimJ/RimL family protein N-acetyltransferase
MNVRTFDRERPSVIGFTLEDNVASRTLMMNLGMKYEGLIEHAGLPHVTHRRLR